MRRYSLIAKHINASLFRFMTSMLALLWIILLSATAFGEGGVKVLESANTGEGKQESKTSAIVVDSTGAMIMTGYTNADLTNDDIWTIKFSPDGKDVLWRAKAGDTGSDRGMAIAIDKQTDNIVVTGYVWNGTNRDIQTIKYCNNSNPDVCKTHPEDQVGKKPGEAIWTHTYHPADNRNAMGLAIAIDDDSNIYIGGNIINGFADDYIIIKYKGSGPNTEGAPVWVQTYDGGYTDTLSSLAVGKDANNEDMIVVTGKSATKISVDPAPPVYRFDAFTKTYKAADEYNGAERKNGTQPIQWRYQAPKDSIGRKVLIDEEGNVIVTATSGGANQNDIFTAKYNATTGSAEPIWKNLESKVAYNNQEPSNMMVDENSGDVIVTGYIYTTTGGYDAYAVRYKGSIGTKVWAQDVVIDSQPGFGTDDFITTIIPDTSGDLYLGGYSVTNPGGLDRFLAIKLAGNSGSLLWKTIEGPVGRDARASGIQLGNNNILLMGGWAYLSETNYDYYMIGLDAGKINPPTGLEAKTLTNTSIKLTWTSTDWSNLDAADVPRGYIIKRKGGGADWAPVTADSITVGPDATSFIDTVPKSSTTYYYHLQAYSKNMGTSNPGNEAHALALIVTEKTPEWQYTYGGTSSRNDFAKSIAVGPDNNPVVTGYVTNQDTDPISNNPINTYDYFTTKLNRLGDENTKKTTNIWTDTYDDFNSQTDVGVGIVVDDTNASYVTGYSMLWPGPGYGEDINSVFTMKYTDYYIQGETPPTLKWESQYNGPYGINDQATTVASAGDGSNNIAVVGYGYNGTYKDRDDQTGYTVIYLLKYLANPALGEDITAPYEWYGKQAPLAKVAFDGGTGNAIPSAVKFDSSGNVLVTGYVQNRTFNSDGKTIAKDYDIFTAKYCGSTNSGCPAGKNPGDLVWLNRYDNLHKDDKAQAIAIDLSNNIYVTGSTTNADSNEDIITIKYCGSSTSGCPTGKNPGDIIWVKTYNGTSTYDDGNGNLNAHGHGDDFGVSVKYDQADDTIVVGGTVHTVGAFPPPANAECSGDHDFIVIRYDADGNVAKNTMGKEMINILARPDNDEVLKDMVMDISGNVTMVGYTTDLARSSSDAISIKFDSELNLVDATVLDGKTTTAPFASLQQDDEATAATVNFLGEVFVAGYSTNAAGNAEFMVYKMHAPVLQVCAPFTATQYYKKVELTWTDTSTTEPQPKVKGFAGSEGNSAITLQDNLQTTGAFWVANEFKDDYLLITSVADSSRSVNVGQYKKILSNTSGRLITVVGGFTKPIGAGDGYSIIHDPTDLTHNGEDGFTIERKSGANNATCSATDPPETNGWVAIEKKYPSHNNSVSKTVTYSDTGLLPGDIYCYRVRSFKTGELDNNRWVMRRVVLDNPLPPVITEVKPINTTQIDISWQTRSHGETGYKIYRCEGDPCVFPDASKTPPNFTVTSSPYSDITVEEGKKYGYKVLSYLDPPNTGWESALSEPGYTTTAAATSPIVSSVLPVNNGLVTINWNPTTNSDRTGYKIRRCKGASCTDFSDNPTAGPVSPASPLKNPVGTVGASSTLFDDTMALESGAQYRYEVCAYKTAIKGWEKCSDATTAITTSSTAPVLQTVSAVSGSSSDITITWSDTTGSESHFIIERCDNTKASCDTSQAFTLVGTAAAGSTSFTDTTVCRNTTYTYRIRAVNHGLSNDNTTVTPGSWSYRSPLDFGTGFKANTLAQVTVDMIPGKMNTGFTDLRIFDESSQKELKYVFSSKTNDSATLVFQTGNTNSLFLYYGNTNATAPALGISDPNLVGYWPFKESYNSTPGKTADISGKGNALSLVGFDAPNGVRVVNGGNAVSFTGTNSYAVKTAPTSALNLTSNFTLTGWIYPKAAQLGGILDRGQEGKSAWEIWYNADRSVSFTQNTGQGGTGTIKTAANSVPINQWTYIAAVYENQKVTLYLNGVPAPSGTATFTSNPSIAGLTPGSDWLVVGANRSGSTDRFFNGWIDEIRIYNTVMSADEVFGHFSAKFSGSPSEDVGLVGYWPFEESPGTPVQTVDASGNGNNLTPTNSTIVAGGVVSGEKTMSFNGSGFYAINTDPSSDLFLSSNFTLMAWINPKGASTGGILDRGLDNYPANRSAWELWYNSDQSFGYAQNWNLGCNGSIYSGAGTVPLNTWSHIAAVYENKKVTLYVNGEAKGTKADYCGNPIPNAGDWFEIGGNRPGGDEWLNGLVDEVRIYKSALTADQVLAIASQATPLAATLQAEQGFSGPFATVWPDLLSNTKEGASNGAAPPDLQPSGVTVFSETQINLAWSNNSSTAAEASGIKVLRCDVQNCSNYKQVGPDLSPGETSFVDVYDNPADPSSKNGLTPNNYYSYKIVAFKNVGCNSWKHDTSTVESNAVVNVKTAPVAPAWVVAETKASVSSECEDIRLTKSDGVLLAAQWAKKPTCGTTNPNIWMRVHDTIPANSAQTVYYYFGNQTAPSINSGSNTFDLYDEFNDKILDTTTNWTVVGSHFSQDDVLIASGGTGQWEEGIYSKKTFNRPFVLEMEHYQTAGNEAIFGAKSTDSGISYTDLVHGIYPFYDGSNNRVVIYEDGSSRGSKKSGILPNVWQYYKMDVLVTGADYYYGTAPDTYEKIDYSTTKTTSPLRVGILNKNQAFKLDNIRVRKGASITPVLTAGAKEYGTWTVDGQTFKTRMPIKVDYTGTTPLDDFQLKLPAVDTTLLQNDRIILTWTDSTSTETGFTVQRCSGSTNCSTSDFIPTVTYDKTNADAGISSQLLPRQNAGLKTVFTDRFVVANTNYCYRVKPDLPPPDNALYSTVVCKTTSNPKGMLGEPITYTTSGSQVNLTWKDYTPNEDGFILERCSLGECVDDADNKCTNCDLGFPIVLGPNAGGSTASPTTITWSDNNTCTGSTYNYRVKSIKPWVADWPSNYSNNRQVGVDPALPPTAVTATRVSETQINLSWSYTPADESVMQVWRCTGDSSFCSPDKFFQVGSDLAKGSAPYYNNNTYSDTGLTPTTTYTYQIRAAKYADTCPWTSISTPTAGHTETASTAAMAPTGFTAIPTESTAVNLSFTDAAVSDSGIKIQRCSGTGCTDFSDINYMDTSSLYQLVPRVFYSFNNTLNDSGVNGLHLTMTSGTTTYEDGGLALKGASFKSVVTPVLNTDSYALDFDIKFKSNNGSYNKIFSFNPGGNDRSPGLWVVPNANQIHWKHDPGNSGPNALGVTGDSNTAFTTGTWYHIRGEKKGSSFKIYVDNNLIYDVNTIQNPKIAGDAELIFGAASGYSAADVVIKNFGIDLYEPLTLIRKNDISITDNSVCANSIYSYRVESTTNLTADGGIGANWTNYMPLAISNFQTNFQTRAIIPWNPKMKADFSDIRFYDASTKTVLPYWIENKTDALSALVWFKTSLSNNIHLYYGNPNATSASNGAAVFSFFDDFVNLNTSVWSTSSSAADISVTGGSLSLNTGGVATSDAIAISPQNMVFEMKNRWVTDKQGATGLSSFSITDSPYIQSNNSGTNAKVENRITYDFNNSSTVLKALGGDGTTASYNLTPQNYYSNPPTNTDLIVGIEFVGTSSMSFYSKDPATYIDKARTTPNVTGTFNKPAYMILGYPFGTNAGTFDGWDMAVDWVRARRYAPTEPVVVLGAEQPPSTATALNETTISQWARKVPIAISNPLANFPTKVTVPASIIAGRSVAELNDLRFRDETAGVELPHWVENISADGSALVWVKIGAVATNVINMYYGNSTAISNSNGSGVFDFFDDFNYGGTSDPGFLSRWSMSDASGAYIVNGKLKITASSVYTNSAISLPTPVSKVFEMKNRWSFAASGNGGLSVCNSQATYSGNASPFYAHADLRLNGSSGMTGIAGSGSISGWNIPTTYLAPSTGMPENKDVNLVDADRIIGIEYQTNNSLYFVSRDPNTYAVQYSSLSTYDNVWNPASGGPTAPYIFLGHIWGNNAGTNTVYPISVDWVRVRPYAATEPSGTVTIASDSPNPLYSAAIPTLSPGAGGSGTWTKSVPLSVANFQPDFETRVNIPASYTAAMKPDLSDLRFYDATAGKELPYWIETKTVETGSTPPSLSGWTQKQRLFVSNYKANFLTRVVIPATYLAGMNPDLSDLRFYDFTAGAEVPYWIQGISSSSPPYATVWLKTLPTSNNTITMYYGNPSATAVRSRDTVFGTGLVGYWPFEEASGTTTGTTADVSGNGANGTLTNSPSIGRGSVYENGLTLNGTSSYLNIPAPTGSPLNISGSVAVEAWYKYDSTSSGYGRIFDKATSGATGNLYSMGVDNTIPGQATVNFMVKDGTNTSNNCTITSPASITSNGLWYHVAGSYDVTTHRLSVFVNGVETYSTTCTLNSIGISTNNITVGQRGASEYLKGILDEVRVYSRALTVEDIAARYASTLPSAMVDNSVGTLTNPAVWLKTGAYNNIIMYYGNPNAAPCNNCNGESVFEFFDDFNGSDIDTNKWEASAATGFTITGGHLHGSTSLGRLTSKSTFSSGVVQEVRAKTTTLAPNGQMIGGFYISSSDGIGWLNHPNNTYYRKDASWVNNGGVQTPSHWMLYSLAVKDASFVKLQWYDLETSNTFWNQGDVAKSVVNEPIVLGTRYDNNTYNGQLYSTDWDWIRIRKYVANEPIVTIGVEQPFSGFTNGNGQTWSTGAPLTFPSFQPNAPARIVIPAAMLGAMKASKASTDIYDLRFFDSMAKTELPYWVESISGSPETAIVWLKPGANSSIYMYYGNPNATSVSNKNAVFGTRALSPAAGMVGFWPFEEAPGTTTDQTADFSGNNKNGDFTNFNSGYGVVSGGIFGNYLVYDGTKDNYVNVPNTSGSPLNITGSATIELWYKHKPVSSNWACILCKSDAALDTYAIWLDKNNNLFPTFQPDINDINQQQILSVSSTLTTGAWHHLLARYDSAAGKFALFVNGVKYEQAWANAIKTLHTNTMPLTIGKSNQTGYTNSINGSLDEVHIYNRALTDVEIAAKVQPSPTIGTSFQVQPTSSWASTYSNTVTVVTPDAGNVVVDPSFEKGAAYWSAAVGTTSNTGFDTTAAYSGTTSLKFAATGVDNALGLQQTVSVLPNMTYKLSGYLKNSLTAGNPQCDVLGGSLDSGGINVPKGTTDWTYSEEYVTIPAGITSVAVRCFADGGPTNKPAGSAWFDMVQLTAQGGNMVRNSGFDNGLSSWTSSSTAATPDTTTSTDNSNSSVKISSGAMAKNSKEYIKQNLTALTPGLTYTLTGNIKANLTSGYAFCRLAVDNSSLDNPGQNSPEFDVVSNSNMTIWTKNDNSIQTPTDTNGTNGRMPLGSSAGSGDVTNVIGAAILKDNGTYRMWYGAQDGTSWRVFYATSPDGMTWTKLNNKIPDVSDTGGQSTDGRIPLGSSGTGDSHDTFVHNLIIDNSAPPSSRYKTWYGGSYDGTNWRIYYATSPDGLKWTKYDNSKPTGTCDGQCSANGQLPPGSAGRGDSASVTGPSVIQDLTEPNPNYRFKMWYSGSTDNSKWRIYYATSPDGITWTKLDNSLPPTAGTILEPMDAGVTPTNGNGRLPWGSTGKGDVNSVVHPMVIKDGANSYKMWYPGNDGSTWRIYYATSSDGLKWTKQNNTPATDSDTNGTGGRIPRGTTGKGDATQAYIPWVLQDGNVYRMWYGGSSGAWRIFNANFNPDNISTSNDNQWHAFTLPVTIKTTISNVDLGKLRILCGISRDDTGPTTSSETAWFDNIQLTASNASFNLTATRISETQINLSWADIYADETGYLLERCGGLGCTNFAPLATLGNGTTSYNDLGLIPDTFYSYRIKTYKTTTCSWNSIYSAVATARTSFSALTSSASARLRLSSPSNGRIDLSWDDVVSGNSGYSIERCVGVGCTFSCGNATCAYPTSAHLKTATANAVSASDTGLTTGTSYSYRIRAYNSNNSWNGNYSNIATIIATKDSAQTTGTLSGTVINTTQINLEWNNMIKGESGYKVERCSGLNCNFSVLDPLFPYYVKPDQSTLNDSTACNGSIPGAVYSYRIYASNEAGLSNSGGGNWSQRAKLNISNFQANLPVRFTIDRPAKMLSFNEMRFIDASTGLEVPYWIERTTAAANGYPDRADVLIKTGATNSIYLYYGNASAQSASSLTGVFGTGVVGYWPFNETAGSTSTTLADRCETQQSAGYMIAGATILPDGGFENVTTSWTSAVGTSAGTSFDDTRSGGAAYEGYRSLKLQATGSTLGLQNAVNVTAGASYTLSGYLKSALTKGTAQCDIYGTNIDSAGIKTTSNNWSKQAETVTIPSGTTTIYVRCFANGAPEGQAWFDGIQLNPTMNPPYGVVTAGRNYNGIGLNGTDQSVIVPDSDNSPLDITGALTIEAWYQHQPSQAWSRIAGKTTVGGMEPWDLYGIGLNDPETSGDKGQHPYFVIANTNSYNYPTKPPIGQSYASPAGPSLVPGNWYHIVGRYNPSYVAGDGSIKGELALFVNGTKYVYPDNQKFNPIAIPVNNEPLTIGRYGTYGNYVKGVIDEVRLYNRALSDGEIQSHYAAVIPTVTGLGSEEPVSASATPLTQTNIIENFDTENNIGKTATWMIEAGHSSEEFNRDFAPALPKTVDYINSLGQAKAARNTINGGVLELSGRIDSPGTSYNYGLLNLNNPQLIKDNFDIQFDYAIPPEGKIASPSQTNYYLNLRMDILTESGSEQYAVARVTAPDPSDGNKIKEGFIATLQTGGAASPTTSQIFPTDMTNDMSGRMRIKKTGNQVVIYKQSQGSETWEELASTVNAATSVTGDFVSFIQYLSQKEPVATQTKVFVDNIIDNLHPAVINETFSDDASITPSETAKWTLEAGHLWREGYQILVPASTKYIDYTDSARGQAKVMINGTTTDPLNNPFNSKALEFSTKVLNPSSPFTVDYSDPANFIKAKVSRNTTVNDGVLEFNTQVNAGASSNYELLYLNNPEKVTGNFDIQFDYFLPDGQLATPTKYNRYVTLRIDSPYAPAPTDTTKTERYIVERATDVDPADGKVKNVYKVQYKVGGQPDTIPTIVATNDLFGKMRIRREGSEVTLYKQSPGSSSWDILATYSNATSNATASFVMLGQYLSRTETVKTQIRAYVDNFKSELLPININDTFASDLSISPNPAAIWTMEAGHYWRSDYSRKLNTASPFNYEMIYMNTAEVLKDDFDIQFDYSLPDGQLAAPTQYNQYVRLRIDTDDDGNGTNQYVVERATIPDPNSGNAVVNAYVAYLKTNGATSANTILVSNDTSGKLRINKKGNLVTVYKKSPSDADWVLMTSANNASHMPVSSLGIMQTLGTEKENTSIRALIDNIAITYPNQNQYSYSWNYSANNSGYSNVVANLVPTSPQPPSGVTATAATAGSSTSDSEIKLTWTNLNTDQTGFKIWKCSPVAPAKTCTPDYTAAPYATTDSSSYTASGLKPSTTYCFGVKAYKNAWCRWDSDASTITATSCDKTGASYPTKLSAAASGSYRIVLNWEEYATDVSGFEIQIKLFGDRWTTIATVGPAERTYTDTAGIMPSRTVTYKEPVRTITETKTYTYRIRNFRIMTNGIDYSPYSNEASASTPPDNQEGNKTCR